MMIQRNLGILCIVIQPPKAVILPIVVVLYAPFTMVVRVSRINWFKMAIICDSYHFSELAFLAEKFWKSQFFGKLLPKLYGTISEYFGAQSYIQHFRKNCQIMFVVYSCNQKIALITTENVVNRCVRDERLQVSRYNFCPYARSHSTSKQSNMKLWGIVHLGLLPKDTCTLTDWQHWARWHIKIFAYFFISNVLKIWKFLY